MTMKKTPRFFVRFEALLGSPGPLQDTPRVAHRATPGHREGPEPLISYWFLIDFVEGVFS